MGMLTVEGVSAKELTEKYGFNILQAYDALLSLKADPKYLNKLKADGYEAQSGCHDDQVMSFMIAQEGTARSPKQHFGEIKISHDSNDWRSM